MKTTSLRLLGATLGATAIVGASTVAATACDLGGHDSTDSGLSSAQAFSHPADRSWGDEHGDLDHHWAHHWTHHGAHHGGHHSHDTASFEDQQAAIIDRLTQADERLSGWIEKAQSQAADNPGGEAAPQLADLQERQADLESLIAAVKTASSEDELKAAFDDARSSASADRSESDGTVTDPAAQLT